jgi:hypothetical protein
VLRLTALVLNYVRAVEGIVHNPPPEIVDPPLRHDYAQRAKEFLAPPDLDVAQRTVVNEALLIGERAASLDREKVYGRVVYFHRNHLVGREQPEMLERLYSVDHLKPPAKDLGLADVLEEIYVVGYLYRQIDLSKKSTA